MIPGEKLTIGGREYIAPPLNLASMRAHKAMMTKAYGMAKGSQAEPDPSDLLEMSEMIVESLKRNYPEVTLESIEADLDFPTLLSAFTRIISAGLVGPSLGEAKPGSQ